MRIALLSLAALSSLLLGCGGSGAAISAARPADAGPTDLAAAEAAVGDSGAVEIPADVLITETQNDAASPPPLTGDANGDAAPAAPDALVDAGPPPPAGRVRIFVSGGNDFAEMTNGLIDLDSGLLQQQDRHVGPQVRAMTTDPGRNRLYIGTISAPFEIVGHTVDPVTGQLREINRLSIAPEGTPPLRGLDDRVGFPDGLLLHPSGRWLLVSIVSERGLAIGVFGLDPRGGLSPSVSRAGFCHEDADFQRLSLDGSGRYVYLMCDGDRVDVFPFDAQTGQLGPLARTSLGLFGLTPEAQDIEHPGLLFDDRHQRAYVMWTTVSAGRVGNQIEQGVARFDQAPHGGFSPALEIASAQDGVLPYGPHPFGLNSQLLLHPNGRFAFATNGQAGTIARFAIDHATGDLALLGHERGGGAMRAPGRAVFSPAGDHLLVTDIEANALFIFRIGPEGGLTPVGAPVSIPRPNWIDVLAAP